MSRLKSSSKCFEAEFYQRHQKVDEMNEEKGKQERRPRKPKYRRPQKTTLKMLRVRFRNRYDINTILPIAI